MASQNVQRGRLHLTQKKQTCGTTAANIGELSASISLRGMCTMSQHWLKICVSFSTSSIPKSAALGLMLLLNCALVRDGSVISIVIEDWKTVGLLKAAIKENAEDIKDPARNLQLFLAKKKDGAWLMSKDLIRMRKGEIPNEVKSHYMNKELEDPTDKVSSIFPSKIPDGTISVVVVEPAGTRKRTRVQDWFADDDFSVHLKKHKVGEDQPDHSTRYFNMAGFPSLAHPMQKYSKIVERDAYAVIFAELMRKVKLCFDAGSGANMVVTGNPGTGKSRFYLYCIFQVLLGYQVEVKELPTFDLVLNCNDEFHKFAVETKEFIELDAEGVRVLRHQRRVLRLVEGTSSELTGWEGVSILFASPGLTGMTNYAKVDSFTYILPVWTFEELQDYNGLLDDGLKLPEDVLVSRYDKFGGIPRFIFTSTELENNEELSMAIATLSALDIISYAKRNHPVKDGNYSHRVLKMVPSLGNFRAKFHLDFLSKYIAEQIVSRVTEESIQKVSEFAIAHADDDSGSTSGVRGKIYEMLCHRWCSLHKQRTLQLRPLCSGEIWDILLGDMPTERFSSLDDIKPPQRWTYYRPTSKTFGALDAFVILGNDCVGLEMTLNRNHGIKAAPLNTFLEWLEGVGIAEDQFHFVFVVPSHLAGSFKKQAIRAKTDSVTGASATVKQYVAALDVFAGDD